MNRTWIRAAATLLLTGAVAACGADAPSSPDGVTVVRVAMIPLGSTLPVHVADKQGIFARHGLRIERTEAQEPTTFAPALTAGRYDIVFSLPTIVLVAADKGLDVQVVNRMQRSTPGSPNGALFTKDRSLDSFAALRGKKIAVPALTGTVPDCLKYLLLDEGVGLHEVELVQTPFPAMGDQLAAGRVDAVVAGIPYSSALLDRGFHAQSELVATAVRKASDGKVTSGMTALFAATAAYTRDHPDVVRAWRRSLQEAVDYLNGHDAEARKYLETWLAMPPAVAQGSPLPDWTIDITPEDLRPYVTIARRVGTIDTEPDVGKLVWQDHP
ncbi:ABC transporter substrate-binding protein [Lentzea sp. NPDC051213]|uniref:ABC transporter substrate-binding protein n=1 Tax=Lentzea sp. NPDC051213 TaxID=3364126 RepID=UPI00379CE0E4